MRHFYVITPISADPQFAEKRAALIEIGRRHGLVPFFPLDHHDLFRIRHARADLRNSSLVLADLSYERPSCYFELGLAQALDVPVVMVAAEGTPIHQVADKDSIHWYIGMEQYRAIVAEALTGAAHRSQGKDAAQGDAADGATRRS